jgi:hypothetical protein
MTTMAVGSIADISYLADKDPCATNTGWSVFQSANSNLTLAGVLAGFLIAVVAALVVQWYDRASPRMIALFASGVPPLTLASYLFTISSGANQPDGLKAFGDRCNQVWSQWLPAFAMLLIGGSVLLCGLGWALVIYSDNLAVRLAQQDLPIEKIRQNQRFFINLSAWLSVGGTAGGAALLMVADVVYLKATVDPNKPQVPLVGCAMFFVFLVGIYVMVRSLYLVITHAYSFHDREPDFPVGARFVLVRSVMENEGRRIFAKEIGVAAAVALGTLTACYLTDRTDQRFASENTLTIVLVVVLIYAVGRFTYLATAQRFAGPAAKTRIAASVQATDESVDLKYSGDRLSATSYNVILFAILGTFFSVALTQGALWNSLRPGLALFIGGLYPACILLGLSYSVAASPHVRLPRWKMLRGLRFLP